MAIGKQGKGIITVLEDKMGELILAVKELTATLRATKSNGETLAVPGVTGKKSAATAEATPVAKTKITFEQIKAAGARVKDAIGVPATRKLVKDHGKAAELASVKQSEFAALMAAFEGALDAQEAEADETEADEDSL